MSTDTWLTDFKAPSSFADNTAFLLPSESAVMTLTPRVILDFQTFPTLSVCKVDMRTRKEERGERICICPRARVLPCLALLPLCPGRKKFWFLLTVWLLLLLLLTGVSDLLRKVVTPHHRLRYVALNNTLCMVKVGHRDIFNILHIRRQTYEHTDIPKLT